MKYKKKLPSVEELISEYPLSEKLKNKRFHRTIEIKNILSGQDSRKILFVGPCSADREDAVLVYMEKLAKLAEEVSDNLLIIPRVYTSKPRTKGVGYKGILHRPNPISEHDDILAGVIATRKLHLDVIEKTGLFAVDEMLYPESLCYIMDLLAYVAVGARSVEDQLHRLFASGLNVPVGMKNPMNGDFNVLLNSIDAAQHPQSLLYQGWEVETEGNEYAHAILRGRVDFHNVSHPNYHYEDICYFHDLYHKRDLKNASVIIDCNHGNSNKQSDEQIRIAKEVIDLCFNFKGINNFVKGLMIESYLEDGCQLIGGNVFGKSITDPCLGWDKTKRLIMNLCDKL